MSTECLEIEVASPFPAEKVFKVFSDFHNIAPKVYPEVYKSVDTIEGDGGVGTVRLLTFGDGVPFTSGKYKVDTVDASSFNYSITFFEGDNLMGILDSVNQHVKVTPSDNGGSLFKLKIVYNCKGDEKPSADALKFEKEVYEKTFKAIDAYVISHPEIMSTECLEIEVASPFPAEKVFKVFSDFHNIAPKVYPEVYKCIDTVEGDGGVGTIRLLTFGDGVPFTSGKYKVDTVDASSFDYSITFFEGDNLMGILDSVNQHVKVTPSDNGGSLFKLKIVYNCKGDEKPSADALKFEKEVYEKTFKAIDAYVFAHPEIMSTECLEIEVASPFPAEKVFKVFSDFHNIAPKVYPEVYKCIDTVEGDGGVGTIRLLTFGDGVPFTSGKYKVDTVDASSFDYSITFFEGDNLMGILDSVNQHVKVTPSDNGGSFFKLKIVYNCKGDEKPSADALKFEKEVYEKTFKAIDAYVVAHPEAY